MVIGAKEKGVNREENKWPLKRKEKLGFSFKELNVLLKLVRNEAL